MGKQSRMRNTKRQGDLSLTTPAHGIDLDAIDKLPVSQADAIRTRINRRLVAELGEPAFGRMSGFESYSLATADTAAFFTILLATERLVNFINRIIGNVVSVEGLPEEYKLTQIRNSLSLLTSEHSLNQTLLLMADDFRAIVKDNAPILALVSPGLINVSDLEDVALLALDLSDSIRLFFTPDKSDNGISLYRTIQNSGFDDIETIMQTMSEKAKSWGRTSNKQLDMDILRAVESEVTYRNAMKVLKVKYPDAIGNPYNTTDVQNFKQRVKRLRNKLNKTGGGQKVMSPFADL